MLGHRSLPGQESQTGWVKQQCYNASQMKRFQARGHVGEKEKKAIDIEQKKPLGRKTAAAKKPAAGKRPPGKSPTIGERPAVSVCSCQKGQTSLDS